MRKSIATVSVSGTLPEKLAAIAQARFQGVEIFESDLVNSPFPPERIRWQAADLGLAIELYQPFRDFEAMPPDRFAANLKRAERKFDVMERLGADTMLVCSNVSPDAIGDDALAAQHLLRSGRAGRGARPDDRLRGAGLGQACPRVPALVGDRPGGRPSGARRVPRQLSHPLPRLGSRGNPPRAGREDLLPAAGRRTGAGHGRAAVVPAPSLLPGSGWFRPDRLRRARAGRRVPRTPLAGGVQRHLPPGRAGIHGPGRDALAALPGGIPPGPA